MGRSWIRNLHINIVDPEESRVTNIPEVQQVDVTDIDNIVSEFQNTFQQRIGCVPNYEVSLKVREGATRVYVKERQVPHTLTERVNKEIDELERAGIITKITNSDWGSPLVVIPKADGGVRLCVDYKVGVNQRLINAHYPIRKIDEILNSLRNSKYFCRLDLYKAYLHIPVDKQSSIIQTISTHRGTYRMNRLSFGIKTAPAEFNRIVDQILRDVPKTESYFDDIVIHDESIQECKNNLKKCLKGLDNFDLHLNHAKCIFFSTSIEFLGYVVQHNKVLKSPAKVAAIVDMPEPHSIEEVRRFLGMVTYYGRFIPNVSTITTPLRKLLKKGERFRWSSECQNAFSLLKQEISSDRVLTLYNPEIPLQLACDASPTGIAAVLSHIQNGEEKPISFASRSLTPAEQNYSQLDREALAIFFGVRHFHEYLYGQTFKLVTDNQPLVRIFHQHSKIPQMTSARLQRYAAFLSGYDYEIIHKPATDNCNVDCLSRATVLLNTTEINFIDQEVHQICSATVERISSTKLNFKTIQTETSKDEVLSKLLRELQHHNREDSEFTIDQNVIFRGQRAVIPKTLQQAVLQELHYTHVGITKMKQLARRYVYWKSIDKDIEQHVRACAACISHKNSPSKAPLHPWEEPVGNWHESTLITQDHIKVTSSS
ncbi:PREDICTED: uncharacterized protein K02A2.6-like [Rhagoletis zephyria]|uniref:uncharacterized protein K02A2.6-like n=1 Tax=Rhagoletis zephyria TaxID=28612 RepID=UPI000811675F|nr:PREDICTED: uncharacterized protein K02A2.6-like [Rhagoletis zephyria]